MSVHPKFDIEHSSCGNCAAFHGSVDGDDPGGTCHRFAPRPTPVLAHFPESGPPTGSTEPQGGIVWPAIDDEFWCLDWFPRANGSASTDESRWPAFFESLSVRAKNALHRAGIRSFAQLDVMPDRDLRLLRNVGVITSDEILEKRNAFPGGSPA